MPVTDNAATFLGINNENEFYSAHYLAEVFKGDISDVLNGWKQKEESDDNYQAPYNRLKAIARDYFSMRERIGKERNHSKAIAMQRQFFKQLCHSLDIPWEPHNRRVETDKKKQDFELPVLSVVPSGGGAKLWVLGALDSEKDDTDPLLLELKKEQFIGEGPHADGLKNTTWYNLINDVVFKQDEPPRWVMLLSDRQCILIDRYKWLQNRLLRFDLDEILGRKDNLTLQATAALLHVESLVPEQGSSLLDNLDENSHKHAFGVSEDLKYALREAIELLGNEAAEQLIQRKDISFTGKSALDADALSRECLRYMYRLLFLFYIEARPELKYVPHQSEAYRKGYSLESLRDLELVKLTSEESRKGYYFHHSISLLFKLIHEGYKGERDAQLGDAWQERGVHNSFTLEKLDSHLFDPKRTPYLNKVKFTNQTLQTVIRLMSLTRETSGRGRKRRGRVSYAQLGINQLGAVYEALLSYRGFFASEDLYEVQKQGENYNELETGYFVPLHEIDNYTEEEKVYVKDENGSRTVKRHPKGKFIYRLAGRDRQKSASYYTPEVLTKCLVKYTLKERLKGLKADEILKLSVCEPAMGSAAFLNEAVNQLAEAYLTLKQQELNKRIPHEEYREALQQVKMHIADHNVFGVDLNPIAVELAEVSLWLNALSQSSAVPWFGYQLFNGNSLIGARRQVYRPDQVLTKKKEVKWYKHEPKRLNPFSLKDGSGRNPEHIYHFLLPDEGMVGVNDAEAKKLKPDAFEKIKQWKKQFLQPLTLDEVKLLQQISGAIDKLWKEHTDMLRADRGRTEDRFTIWGQSEDEYHTSTQQKDQIRSTGIFNKNAKIASPYRRLKLVMDYWCALWFWPLDKVDMLPDRSSWLFELNLLLQGQVFSFQAEQSGFDFTLVDGHSVNSQNKIFPKVSQQGLFFEDDKQSLLTENELKAQQVRTAKGELHLEKLLEQFPRLNLANHLAEKYKFFHWELNFADVFSDRGGFDVMLGNPPWLKVEFDELGVLGDFNPRFVFKTYENDQFDNERTQAIRKESSLEYKWFEELSMAEGIQRLFSSKQLYPLLIGQKANLYKAFITLSWELVNDKAYVGLLHQEGFYEAKRGERAREEIYRRLISHFQFYNERELFSTKDVHHSTSFSINIYRKNRGNICFANVSNLFSVNALDECLDSNREQPLEGIRSPDGEWSVRGCPDRKIVIDESVLKIFHEVYDSESHTALGSRLANIHASSVLSIVAKISKKSYRLEGILESIQISQLFDEKVFQKNKMIKKDVGYRGDELVVLSGPNTTIANSYYKSPKDEYRLPSDYSIIDLTDLPLRPKRKTLFKVEKPQELIRNIPLLEWDSSQRLTAVTRVGLSEWVSSSSERTLAPFLLDKNEAHLDTIVSLAFKNESHLIGFLGLACALPTDFLVRSTGTSHIKAWLIYKLPYIEDKSQYYSSISVRALALNCLTERSKNLWDKLHIDENESWASVKSELLTVKLDDLRYSRESAPLRTYYERRQALIELDVLAAMYYELTLDELLALYRTQFSVLMKYEKETWYDSTGNIIFTCNSQGLKGVGLSRKACSQDSPVNIEYPDGSQEQKLLGWENIVPQLIKAEDGTIEQSEQIPDGTKIHRKVIDDTLPGGPREKVITYVAPFYLPDREEDYRIAWKIFTERFKEDKS